MVQLILHLLTDSLELRLGEGFGLMVWNKKIKLVFTFERFRYIGVLEGPVTVVDSLAMAIDGRDCPPQIEWRVSVGGRNNTKKGSDEEDDNDEGRTCWHRG